jgi:hypothetical protein
MLPNEIETASDATRHFRCRTAAEKKLVFIQVWVEEHRGRRGQPVERDRQGPNRGDVLFDIALSPVLDQGEVGVGNGRSLHVLMIPGYWIPIAIAIGIAIEKPTTTSPFDREGALRPRHTRDIIVLKASHNAKMRTTRLNTMKSVDCARDQLAVASAIALLNRG